jgi:hypothetical protein
MTRNRMIAITMPAIAPPLIDESFGVFAGCGAFG